MKNKVEYYLDIIGMDNRLKGYKYLIDAIDAVIKANVFVNIKNVYSLVSKTNFNTAQNVERSIRYAIENTWEKGSVNEIDKLFGYTVDKEKGKPTNSEFIFLIADKIKIS